MEIKDLEKLVYETYRDELYNGVKYAAIYSQALSYVPEKVDEIMKNCVRAWNEGGSFASLWTWNREEDSEEECQALAKEVVRKCQEAATEEWVYRLTRDQAVALEELMHGTVSATITLSCGTAYHSWNLLANMWNKLHPEADPVYPSDQDWI